MDAVPAKSLNVTASHLESFILTRTEPQNNDLQELAEPNGVTPQVNISENLHLEDAEPLELVRIPHACRLSISVL